MDLPAWVYEAIREFEAPVTGQVTLVIERYQGGVTKIELGGTIRITPKTAKVGILAGSDGRA